MPALMIRQNQTEHKIELTSTEPSKPYLAIRINGTNYFAPLSTAQGAVAIRINGTNYFTT